VKTKTFQPFGRLPFLFQDFAALLRAIDKFGDTVSGGFVEREIRAHAADTLDFAGVRKSPSRFVAEVAEVENHFRLRVKEILNQAPSPVTPKMVVHNRPLALVIWAVAEELRPHLEECSRHPQYMSTL
jgi:hypothetical protein